MKPMHANISLGRVGVRGARLVCHGKKGSGSKGGKSAISDLLKKKEAQQQAQIAKPDEYRDPEVRALLLYMCNSYYKATGQYLLEADFDALPDAAFNAPFVLLAHNRFQEGVKDPTFIYANRAGLNLWDATWSELIGMPSRKSAADDPSTQQDRNALLDKAAESKEGVIQNYEGWRVSLKGKKFRIKGVTLFNILDPDGDKIGQAVRFDKYETAEGKEVVVSGYTPEGDDAPPPPQLPPSQEEIDAAEAAVKQWGDYVRTLKEAHGLGNKDPQVVEAVGNLTAWKATLADLKARLEAELATQAALFDDEDEDA